MLSDKKVVKESQGKRKGLGGCLERGPALR